MDGRPTAFACEKRFVITQRLSAAGSIGSEAQFLGTTKSFVAQRPG
ncbi:MAG: hypothetical protein JWQ31_4266 [Mycobacterium sp.]|nr:hypothetical protein [Mycobacterium sp.]